MIQRVYIININILILFTCYYQRDKPFVRVRYIYMTWNKITRSKRKTEKINSHEIMQTILTIIYDDVSRVVEVS